MRIRCRSPNIGDPRLGRARRSASDGAAPRRTRRDRSPLQRGPEVDEHRLARLTAKSAHRLATRVVGMARGAYVMQLGQVPYGEAWDLQRALAGAVSQGAVP